MTAALRDNDFALSDHQLQRSLQIIVEEAPDSDLAEASAEYRKALGAEATHQRLNALRQTLAAAGFVTFHSFMRRWLTVCCGPVPRPRATLFSPERDPRMVRTGGAARR